MKRLVFAIITVSLTPLAGQQLEFEVASIRRNLADSLPKPGSSGRVAPAGGNPMTGQIDVINVLARTLVLAAYPVQTIPVEVVGLPSWADSERYDVLARARPRSSPDDLAQMWRTLLADRMKLAAHYETRPRSGYNLVFARADRRPGMQLRRATGSCPATSNQEPPEAFRRAMSQREPLSRESEEYILGTCGGRATVGDTVYAGHIPFKEVVALLTRAVGSTVVDRTGLDGLFSLKLTFAQRPSVTPDPDDLPSIFTAVQEQLGLKLESATVEGQVLVIDRLERPTPN